MRRLSQTERILDLLLKARKKNKKVHMRELNKIAYRYGSRIFDLRRKGYIINTTQLKRGEFVYELKK